MYFVPMSSGYHLPAVYIHLSSNEKRHYVIASVCDSLSQDIPSQIYNVIQSDVALHLQVH